MDKRSCRGCRRLYTAMGLTNASSRRTKAMRTIAERCFIASPPPHEAAGRPALLRAARRQRRRAGSSGSYSGTYSMTTYSTRMYRNHLTVYSSLVRYPPAQGNTHHSSYRIVFPIIVTVYYQMPSYYMTLHTDWTTIHECLPKREGRAP